MENTTGRLTERQRRFADLYLQLGNAAEAAEQAGFKRSYAQGAKRQPAVRAYMDERLRQAQDRNIASADEVLSFLFRAQNAEKCTILCYSEETEYLRGERLIDVGRREDLTTQAKTRLFSRSGP